MVSRAEDVVTTGLNRAAIRPVPETVSRPLWSVMIPTYNCGQYLCETLRSVLAQDPGPEHMQIEVVDDCSTEDDPEAMVRELAGERVTFYQQPQNVGHVHNFNTCLQRAHGRLIHLLHGDDAVRPGFYATMQQAFEREPGIGAAFCRDIRMNEQSHWESIVSLLQSESGVLSDWLETIGEGQRLQTPAMVVRREVYENLGGFDSRIRYYGEDWEMWVRIAAHYPVWYEIEPLAIYRVRSSSLSGITVRTGENGRDLRRAIELNKAHLPQDKVKEISRKARFNFARASIQRSYWLLSEGRKVAALVQLRESLKSSLTPEILLRVSIAFLIWTWTYTRGLLTRDSESERA